MAMPMVAQNAKGEVDVFANFRVGKTTHKTLQVKKVQVNTLRGDVPAGYASVTLAADDVWSDGSGYQMLLDADATAYGTIIPTSGPLTSSGDASAAIYAEFEYKIPENADGSCSSSNIIVDDAATILIPAGTYDYCITNPTPGDRVWISSDGGNIPGRYDNYEFLSGVGYVFYVSYGGQNDRVDLEIDDPFAPVVPENVTANPTATTADVAWENDHDPIFNLRYRVYDPNAAFTRHWGAEDNEDYSDWYLIDADGDGYTWGISAYEDAVEGSNLFYSSSYQNYTPLDPDNYLITEELLMGGTLTFWAAAYSNSWPDSFGVYLMPDIDDETTWVEIMPWTTAIAEGNYYTIDLSAYDGMARIAFRHYDSYNEFYLFLDDITYEVPGNEPAEWIYVNGVEGNNYTIEGLDPETTYEVQVQAQGEDGRTSDWTASTLFTTLTGDVDGQCLAPNSSYEITGTEIATVTIVNREEGATVNYEVYCNGVLIETGSFTGDEYSFDVTGAGNYVIHAIATKQGKEDSFDGGVFFTILEGEGLTGINELNNGKNVASVRYFNAMGQEMQSANGMTIVVTTYTDGTTSTAKVMK